MPRRAKVRPHEPGREKILDAALELFGERGYEAASIAAIGARAEITKSVLYHYFSSKADLYTAVLQAQSRELVEHVAAALPADPDDPRLREGVEAYLDFLAGRPAAWRLLLRDPPTDPDLRDLFEALTRERAAALAGLLASERKRTQDPLHLSLVETGIRAFAAWWYEHREVPREVVVAAILDFAGAATSRI
jgi:AcrR family transcriptional regulator